MALDRDAMLRLIAETGLYLVTEDAVPSERRLRAVAEALGAGARVVQLRDKRTARGLLLDEAREMRALCSRHRSVFLVNDDVALAWCADADGVHVGQDDLPPEEARHLMGKSKLIGLSVSAVGEALRAEAGSVDYLGVGAMYATPTKVDAELGGLDLLRGVRRAVAKPLVAIGGIDASNAGDVFAAGADAVAIVRGVFSQPSVVDAVRNLLNIAVDARQQRGR